MPWGHDVQFVTEVRIRRLFSAPSRLICTGSLSAYPSVLLVALPRRLFGRRLLRRTLFSSVVFLLTAHAQAATTLTVTSLADSGTGSLRDALTQANASSGDIINFSGVTGTMVLQSALPAITQSMTIMGPGASQLKISGNDLYPVFSVSSGTVGISGLTIANGNNASSGGAIPNHGTLTVSNTVFSGNSAAGGSGGAIANFASLIVVGSTFVGNSSSDGGGIYSQSKLTVSNSTFSGNSASAGAGGPGYGGAIASVATLTVSNSTFSGNASTEGAPSIANPS
jgi:predicted outer membrane repeat protein